MEIIAFQSARVYLGSDWKLMAGTETAWWAECGKKCIAVNRKKNGELKQRKEMSYITVETFCLRNVLCDPCGVRRYQIVTMKET